MWQKANISFKLGWQGMVQLVKVGNGFLFGLMVPREGEMSNSSPLKEKKNFISPCGTLFDQTEVSISVKVGQAHFSPNR